MKNRYKLLAIAILIIGVLIALVLVSPYLSAKAPVQELTTPTPTATPAPSSADVSLSPDNQTVVVSLSQTPSFSLTFSQVGNRVAFPCSVTLYYSTPDNYGGTSLPLWTINGYGTFQIPQPQSTGQVPTIQALGSTSFWVVIQDSKGNDFTSNTVTVQYT